MKKILLALILALPMMAMAVEKPWKNGKLKISENSRFLQFENGTPFFWQGETGWLLPQRGDRAEAAYYLQRCAEAGYNMVQIQVVDGTPSYNIYGEMSLVDGWNFENIDRKGVYG